MLWLIDPDPPFAFSLADERLELVTTLILRGACEQPADPAEVVDLAAVRAARNGGANA